MSENSDSCKRPADEEHHAQAKRCKPSPEPDPSTKEIATETPAKSKKAKRDGSGWAKQRRGKQKDDKNRGRRSRNEEDANKPNTEEHEGETSASKGPRLPKRQCALLIGFCGTGCNGMQIQNTRSLDETDEANNVRTIEGVLFKAMVNAGAVSQDNANDPVKVNLGRAARTDAGVHAAGNVVSIKMITAVPGVPDIVARINEELPPEIRVWGFVRVQNSFNARTSCDSRKYTYFFPSYLMIPPEPDSNLSKTLSRALEGSTQPDGANPMHPFWLESEAGSASPADELYRKRKWHITPDLLESLRTTAKKLEGTHNFHNFTVGREFNDRSSQRYMQKIEVSDPAVYGNTEWISVLFHGQSFMLHQIRKMMSSLVLSCRTGTPPQVIDELYGPRMVLIPKMPSLGLLLEYPVFGSYNNKVTTINAKLEPSDPEYRPPIDFEIYRETIDKFKQKYIYDNMRSIEDRDGIFDAWIRSIDSYKGDDLLYLNAKGVIPTAAVVKKGEKRSSGFKEKKRFDATSFPEGGDMQDELEEMEVDKKQLADMEG